MHVFRRPFDYRSRGRFHLGLFPVAPGGPTFTLAVTVGATTLTGQTVAFKVSRKLPVTHYTFLFLLSQNAFNVSRKLPVTVGASTLTGQTVNLTYTPVGGADFTLPVTVGASTFTGQTVGFKVSRKLPVLVGTCTITGQAVGLNAGRKLAVAVGACTFNAQSVNLTISRKLLVTAGSCTVNGQTVVLTYSGAEIASLIYVASSSLSVVRSIGTLSVPKATATISP